MGEKLKELAKKPIFWVIVAGVAIFAIVRGRAAMGGGAAAQASETPSPGAVYGGGGGGGTGEQTGTSIADQLANLDLLGQQQQQKNAQALADINLQEQQRRFNLSGPLEAARAALDTATSNAQAAIQNAQQNYFGQIAGKQVSCPGNASVRIDPSTGQAYCRQKTSGGILGLPLGDISRTVQGFFSGVEAAAPGIGYGAANAAGAYYTGQYFSPNRTSTPKTSGGAGRSSDGMASNGSGVTPSYANIFGPNYGGNF